MGHSVEVMGTSLDFVVGLERWSKDSHLFLNPMTLFLWEKGVRLVKWEKKCKKCNPTLGMPKFVQLNEKFNEVRAGKKGRGGLKKGKEKVVANIEEVDLVRGGELEVVLPICPLTPALGMNFFMEEMGTMVPDTPLTVRSESLCKEVDASRLLELEKKAGITFNVLDGEVVMRLVNLEDVDVLKKVVRKRNVGDQ